LLDQLFGVPLEEVAQVYGSYVPPIVSNGKNFIFSGKFKKVFFLFFLKKKKKKKKTITITITITMPNQEII
jgi:hypothetical protein